MKLPTLPLLLNTPRTESAGRQIRGAIQVSLFLLLAAVPRAASATGYWKVSFKVEGHYQKNKKSDDKDVPISSATPFRDVWNNSAPTYTHPDDFMVLPAPGGGFGGGANSGGLSFYLNDYGFQSVTTNMSGALRVTPILSWIEITDPNDTPELPPTKILLKVSSLAEAVGVGDGLPAVATSSNGFGDPSIPQGARTVSTGYKFVMAEVPSDGVVTLNTIDLSAKLAGTVGWYLTPVYPNISLRVSVEVDQRKVWITSPTIEHSFYKSNDVAPPGTPQGVPGPFPPSRQPHKRERDLSMVVDSVAFKDPFRDQWVGGGTFTASSLHFANPSYTWRLDNNPQPYGSSTTSSLPFSTSVPDLAIDLGGDAHGLGMKAQSVVKLLVRDSDGMVFPTTYTVNWHMPAENATVYHTGYGAYMEVPLEPAQGTSKYAGPGESATATVYPVQVIVQMGAARYEALTMAGVAGAGLTAAFPASFALAPETIGTSVIAGILIGLSGYVVTHSVPDPLPTSVTNNYDEWTKAVNATKAAPSAGYVFPSELAVATVLKPDNPDQDEAWISCGMRIVRKQKYKDVFSTYDEYDAHGYVGQKTGVVSTPTSVEDRGYYMQNWQQNDP